MRDMMEIKTNNEYQEIKYSNEVPQDVLDDYDWLEEEDKAIGWVNHKDTWYHTSDFMVINKTDPNQPFNDWDGYHSDSYFSGVLIKFSNCGDCAKMGTYMS